MINEKELYEMLLAIGVEKVKAVELSYGVNMTGLKCDRCGQEIKSGESWERDVHDKPFSPYESEYAFNKYGGNARHVGDCPTKPDTKPTDLELLVIDLGDSCVVKVEAGQGNPRHMLAGRPIYGDTKGTTVITPMPFTKLREALEQKPVPRIEVDGGRMNYYRVVTNHVLESPLICPDTYKALSQLAGKPLPVWKGGEWERLPSTSEYIDDPLKGTGVAIWRYMR